MKTDALDAEKGQGTRPDESEKWQHTAVFELDDDLREFIRQQKAKRQQEPDTSDSE